MSTEVPIVTAYYRCSHILFKVAKALPLDCDRDSLFAVLSPDAVVRPESPLRIHKGPENKDGIHTFLGTFRDGKSLYLFSSAQIDHLRYWLHALKLTSQVIPPPSSEHLFTQAELSTVSPVVHPTFKSLRGELKRLTKTNARDMALASSRNTFQRVQSVWAAKTGAWCAIDFETWTENHGIITEFGYSALRWARDGGKETRESGHFTVQEHRLMRNGKYGVPEYREHYNLEFGTSVELTKAKLKSTICDLISGMHANGPLFLVFHDSRGDIKTLNGLGAPIGGTLDQLPDYTIPTEGIFIVDTQVLFSALTGNRNQTSLGGVCDHLKIPTVYLHNAGNDAHYTLDALQAMASGKPLDAP
ncbi:hypothetical protein K438DRAFT_1829496 [Mycena galopus ATCC 62051]|nr:hypothetical protein K438DRAFT_1829496 [Mycena galopus ATCC 62051]